jgi:hypothetical protein
VIQSKPKNNKIQQISENPESSVNTTAISKPAGLRFVKTYNLGFEKSTTAYVSDESSGNEQISNSLISGGRKSVKSRKIVIEDDGDEPELMRGVSEGGVSKMMKKREKLGKMEFSKELEEAKVFMNNRIEI